MDFLLTRGFPFLDDRALTSAKGIQEWRGARKASLGRFPRTEERKVDRTVGGMQKSEKKGRRNDEISQLFFREK